MFLKHSAAQRTRVGDLLHLWNIMALPTTAPVKRPYLVVLKEGPSNSLEDIEPHCVALATRFRGELWTYGCYEADRAVGDMKLRVVRQPARGRFTGYLAFWREVMKRAATLKRESAGQVIVVSYDPFKTGLLAHRFARAVGGLFVAEVNGAYGDPDTFADLQSKLWRQARLVQMRLTGAYVLKRADGIKLLFDRQLQDFALPRKSALIRRFYDIAYVDRFFEGPEEPIILLAGFPYRRKGADILFEAFSSLAPRFPEWKLVMIGHELKSSMDAAGFSHPQVSVHPGMPQTELVNWVARCSIVAQPSRSEAMGRILLEAAAAGKCRIGTAVNGIPTVISDGVDGVLVPKNDVEALARALELLIVNPELRRRLGAAAKARASSEFTYDAYLDHYSEFFDALCSTNDHAELRE
jgi:glycosyltransferase involved in cell wall biosynthesis